MISLCCMRYGSPQWWWWSVTLLRSVSIVSSYLSSVCSSSGSSLESHALQIPWWGRKVPSCQCRLPATWSHWDDQPPSEKRSCTSVAVYISFSIFTAWWKRCSEMYNNQSLLARYTLQVICLGRLHNQTLPHQDCSGWYNDNHIIYLSLPWLSKWDDGSVSI